MTDNSAMPPAEGMASPGATAKGRRSPAGHAVKAALLVLAGGIVAGLIAGFVWAAVAPRVQYQVYTLKPPTAYATNPETSAFIAADGLYSFIALAGGAVLGLLAYLFAVRRYRVLPLAGLITGSVAAALITAWLGHWASGGAGFDHLLATSKPGSYLYAPISLGSPGALAFWPLGAAAVVGGIELVGTLRARQQAPYGVPMPGMESFGRSAAGQNVGSSQPAAPPDPQPARDQQDHARGSPTPPDAYPSAADPYGADSYGGDPYGGDPYGGDRPGWDAGGQWPPDSGRRPAPGRHRHAQPDNPGPADGSDGAAGPRWPA